MLKGNALRVRVYIIGVFYKLPLYHRYFRKGLIEHTYEDYADLFMLLANDFHQFYGVNQRRKAWHLYRCR